MWNKESIQTEYLIIGNSAGGIGAAEAIREIDRVGRIIMVTDEPYFAYSRPLIAKLLTAERNVQEICFRTPQFYAESGIELMTSVRVERILPDEHLAILHDGRQIAWGKLLLATGGQPIIPQIDGIDLPGVFHFIDINDAEKIADYIKEVKKAVVIGGGLIGLSVSEALYKKGIQVSIVEMRDRILNTIIDKTGSAMAAQAIEKKGIEIIINHTLSRIEGKHSVKAAVLDDGREIPCDVILAAIGVIPRIELAVRAGLKTGRGIIVDQNMTTSHADIFTCGDAAEAFDFIREAKGVIPIWPNAYIGGSTAGCNMAGQQAQYPPCTVMNSLNYFGINLVSAGIVNATEGEGYEILSRHAADLYKKIVTKDNHIVGLVFINDIEKSGLIFGMMRDRIDIEGFKQFLLDDDFGLSYLPTPLRQQHLGNAQNINTDGLLENKKKVLAR
jgi:nitrite reductase (NADH) large subunit